MPEKPKYGEYLDTLVALVTHLAATRYKSRTPHGIATSLSLDHDEVQTVLKGFRGLFHESAEADRKTGEKYYTVHLRYALRSQDDGKEGDEELAREPLPGDQLIALIDFIRHSAEQERFEETTRQELKSTRRIAWIAAASAIIAALISAGALSWLGLAD
jgi:hypothetical protein